MLFFTRVLLGFLAIGLLGSLRADDLHFSQKLSETDRQQSGLVKLSAEQVSILDALVQREQSLETDFSRKAGPGYRFSQRIAPDKRHSAGIDQLSASELTRLDELVSAKLSVAAVAAPEAHSAAPIATERLVYAKPQIHGEIGFMVGVGSHGYSEYGGHFLVNYTDPSNRYSVSFLYAETHVKGGFANNRCFDYGTIRDTSIGITIPHPFTKTE